MSLNPTFRLNCHEMGDIDAVVRPCHIRTDLHVSTASAAIADEQRTDLARLLALAPDATAAELSAILVLPVNIITRRRAELDGTAPRGVGNRLSVVAERAKRIGCYLRKCGPATLAQIAAALSMDLRLVERAISCGGFVRAGEADRHHRRGARRILWSVEGER